MNVKLLVKATSLDQNLSDLIRIAVGGGSAIFQVAFAVFGHVPWNPDGAAPVGDSGGEVVNGGGFVEAGETTLVVLALVGVVGLDVANVVAGQLVDGGLDVFQTAVLTHLQRGEVGVSAGAVPVTLHWLRIHGDDDTEVLGSAMK